MPLGALMLLTVAALVTVLWLYNAWPEWQLRAMAKRLGVPPGELMTPNLRDLWDAVGQGIENRYRQLYHAATALALRFRDIAGPEEASYILELIEKTPGEHVSEENLDRLEGICWEMEDAAKNPLEHAFEAAEVAREVNRFRRICRKHRTLRLRVRKAPA